MTNEELNKVLENLYSQQNILESRIKALENPPQPLVQNSLVETIDELRTDILYIKSVRSTTSGEPFPKPDAIMLWNNTTTGKYYLKANFKGTNKKIELI